MIEDLLAKLDDPVAVVRQAAATALGDLGHQAAEAVAVLRQRLLSAQASYHDRACTAWALSQIVVKENEQVVGDLFHVLHTAVESPVADELRFYCAVAIQQLASDSETITILEQLCAADTYWRCKVLAGLEAEPDPDVELARFDDSLKYGSSAWNGWLS